MTTIPSDAHPRTSDVVPHAPVSNDATACVDLQACRLTVKLVIISAITIRQVDRRDPTDLYEHVAAEIRRAIADGEARPGERLPPAKTSPRSST